MIRVLFVLLVLMGALPAWAETLPMKDFSQIPVQHEGRIKPLDSFARVTLKAFSGSDMIGEMRATEWMAETLFDPMSSAGLPVFKIRDATTRHQLGLMDRADPVYSYLELTEGLGHTAKDVETLYNKPPQDVTAQDRALMQIHDNALIYTQILRTLSLVLPLNIETPEPWASMIKSKEEISYLDLRRYERDIEEATRNIVTRKGSDPSAYSETEQATALLGYQLRLMGDAASRNQLLRIIPVPWADAKGEWQSPWSVLQQGLGSPETGALLQVWRDLAQAWQKADRTSWHVASQQARQMPMYMSGHSDFWKLELETANNEINPLKISTAFYILALLLGLGFLVSGGRYMRFAALSALAVGAIVHTVGIGTRVILLERPPVSTLYESIIFVSLICVLIGMMMERKLKSGSGLFIASVAGVFLGLMATSFSADSDTLKMLSAVLDTQFWLATHVLCISFGYGWCVITALLAHLNLAYRAFRMFSPEKILALESMTGLASLIALLFTAIGTILGGIWADQSWGRFWGWDPKENGALLIVLWLTWLQHGKLSQHLSPVALLAGQAFLNVIVALAWLGVNLLGVGLHSYGFTTGLFWGLGLFVLAEMIYIGVMWFLISKPARPPVHAP